MLSSGQNFCSSMFRFPIPNRGWDHTCEI